MQQSHRVSAWPLAVLGVAVATEGIWGLCFLREDASTATLQHPMKPGPAVGDGEFDQLKLPEPAVISGVVPLRTEASPSTEITSDPFSWPSLNLPAERIGQIVASAERSLNIMRADLREITQKCLDDQVYRYGGSAEVWRLSMLTLRLKEYQAGLEPGALPYFSYLACFGAEDHARFLRSLIDGLPARRSAYAVLVDRSKNVARESYVLPTRYYFLKGKPDRGVYNFQHARSLTPSPERLTEVRENLQLDAWLVDVLQAMRTD